MILFVPYSTDAPIYHPPIATIGLILANAVVFFCTYPNPQWDHEGAMDFGRLVPWQWFTYMFVHANLSHLLGNMLFLWVFGLLVEGKLGWWRMLVAYLAIGTMKGALVQLIMLSADGGGALGASGAIYGLLAMAFLWAPFNNVNWVIMGWLFFRPIYFEFEVSVLVMGIFYIGSDFLSTGMTMRMSTPFLHSAGAVVGFAVGFLLMHYKWVDCEGWDIFSCMNHQRELGRKGGFRRAGGEVSDAAVIEEPLAPEQIAQRRGKIRRLVEQKAFEEALRQFDNLKRKDAFCEWTEPELLAVIDFLHQCKDYERLLPYLVEYMERFPESASKIKLLYAHLLVHVYQRPSKAKAVLDDLNPQELSEAERRVHQQLLARAVALIDDGFLELQDD